MKDLSFKKASVEVLKKHGKPMSRDEIAEQILILNLVASEGKTPEATIAAQIYTDIKNNPNSPFMIVSRGLFALRDFTPSSDPKVLIKKHNDEIKDKLKKRLSEMDPFLFEHFIGELLEKIGFENVKVTKRSADGGIDIHANLTLEGVTNVRTVVQVKRYAKNVEDKIIRQLRGSANIDERGLVITTSGFTKPAIEEAKAASKMPVSLIDGTRLIELLIKHELGIKKEIIEVLYQDEEAFELKETQSPQTPEDKHRAIWPLPGGVDSYVTTLNSYLEYVAKNEPSKKVAAQWFIKNFKTVNSEQTATNYAMVPRYMGLMIVEAGKLKLTKEGSDYISKKNLKHLFEILDKHLYLVSETVEFFKSSDEPMKAAEVLEYLNNEYSVGWSSEAQVTFRLLWLMNLKVLKKVDDGFLYQR
ncbi:MAG: restriction endonuclease [Bdellovibrionota bacterium]